MTMSRASGKPIIYLRDQLPIDYIDTSLVINTWENVSADLSGGKPVELLYIILEQTNNGATPEDLELELTMLNPSTLTDATYTWSFAADSGGKYYCVVTTSLSGGDLATFQWKDAGYQVRAADPDHSAGLIMGSVGLIRVRQTSAVDGVSAQIEVNIVYRKLVGV